MHVQKSKEIVAEGYQALAGMLTSTWRPKCIYNSNGYYSSDFMITELTKISPNAQGVEALGYMATLRRVCNANLAIKINTCPSEPQGDEMKCVDYIPPPKLLRCHAKPQSFDSKI